MLNYPTSSDDGRGPGDAQPLPPQPSILSLQYSDLILEHL